MKKIIKLPVALLITCGISAILAIKQTMEDFKNEQKIEDHENRISALENAKES